MRDGLAVLDVHYVECDGRPAAFVAVGGDKVEMLFVDPEFFGLGAGGMLMKLAIEAGARYVDVNEQNTGARGFTSTWASKRYRATKPMIAERNTPYCIWL